MNYKKWAFFILRVFLGVLLLYAGYEKVHSGVFISKVLPGYLNGAVTFHGFYAALAKPGIINVVGYLNEWGQIALGLALILGIWVKWAAKLGALMMILYYFPTLKGLYPTAGHAFIVDEHLIYAAALLCLDSVRAGRYLGFDRFLNRE